MSASGGVFVSALGASSAVGWNLAATQAAVEARLLPFAATEVLDHQGEPVRAARLTEISPDATRWERLAALAAGALRDVLAEADWGGAPRLPLYCGLPEEADATVARRLAAVLGRSHTHNVDLVFHRNWAVAAGRSAFFPALAAAVRHLQQGSDECVLVGAADSQCDGATLTTLAGQRRILAEGVDGLLPGEGAAFLLLRRSDGSEAQGGLILEGPVQIREARSFLSGEPNLAEGLTDAFRQLRGLVPTAIARVDRVLSCQTGEGFWSREFGAAYLRQARFMPEPLRLDWMAQYLGDTGAAAGPLALGLAQHRLARAQSGQGERHLIYACSDSGLVGALAVSAAGALQSRLDREILAQRASLAATVAERSSS